MRQNYAKLACLLTLVILAGGCTGIVKDHTGENEPEKACVPDAEAVVIQSEQVTYPLKEIFKFLPERKEEFHDKLRLQVSINNIRNVRTASGEASTIFDINVYFKNPLASSIVFRNPQNMGFMNDPTISEGGSYDLTIHLRTGEGLAIGTWGEYSMLYAEAVHPHDFISLAGNQTFCLPVNLKMPAAFVDDVGYDSLPAGKYSLHITYANYMIGYQLPLLETPPTGLPPMEELAWDHLHKKQVDLNSWVGELSSEEIEFDVGAP